MHDNVAIQFRQQFSQRHSVFRICTIGAADGHLDVAHAPAFHFPAHVESKAGRFLRRARIDNGLDAGCGPGIQILERRLGSKNDAFMLNDCSGWFCLAHGQSQTGEKSGE